MFLYLLQFKNLPSYFKIGITKNVTSRVSTLRNTWGELDYDNSFVVTSPKERSITLLERELHLIFPDDDNFIMEHKGKDGYSEFRSLSHFDECLDIIKVQKHSSFNFSVNGVSDYIEEQNPMLKRNKESVVVKKKSILEYNLLSSNKSDLCGSGFIDYSEFLTKLIKLDTLILYDELLLNSDFCTVLKQYNEHVTFNLKFNSGFELSSSKYLRDASNNIVWISSFNQDVNNIIYECNVNFFHSISNISYLYDINDNRIKINSDFVKKYDKILTSYWKKSYPF